MPKASDDISNSQSRRQASPAAHCTPLAQTLAAVRLDTYSQEGI